MAEIPTKAQLLTEIRAEWARFETLLGGLNDDQMTTPGVQDAWSIKDMLAHITVWEKVLLDRLQAVSAGQATQYPPIQSEDDINKMNAQIYAENKDRPLGDVLSDFRAVHAEVLTAVEGLDEDLFAGTLPLGWETDPPAWRMIAANTNWHYQEHRQVLEAWLSQKPG